jgi:two-component system chemotaxis sensor kinase CheA
LVRARASEVRRVEGRAVLVVAGGPTPLATLARVLGPPLTESAHPGAFPVVVLQSGARRAGLIVDELLDEQEVVLRPVRLAGSAARLVSGAAVLGSGRVAPVLDATAVLEMAERTAATVAPSLGEAATAGAKPRHRILVVDDSITTRTLEQSVLEAAGYDVRTAVDGADAWRQLQESAADLVVADVEMPHMDGFALCEAIRASKRFAELPVVLVTALETTEHRARGLEVGADAYIGKSSFDQQGLLDIIQQLLD